MSSYLTDLTARSLDPNLAIQPRIASLFEPADKLWTPLFPAPSQVEDSAIGESVAHPAFATKEAKPEMLSRVTRLEPMLETPHLANETSGAQPSGRPAEARDMMRPSDDRFAPENVAARKEKTSSPNQGAIAMPAQKLRPSRALE